MSIEQEIRNEIDNIKQLKIDVGDINSHLSVLEELCRNRNQKAVDNAYQKGYEEGRKVGIKDGMCDAWEAAKKLFSSMADSDIEKVFPIEWNNGGFKALMNLQPQEALDKLKVYEDKQKDSIEVGDEVIAPCGKAVVTLIETDDLVHYLYSGGDYGCIEPQKLTKTGKHYDIASILEAMRK